jgi:hypothetical protein
MKLFLMAVGFVCWMFVAMFIWEKSSGEQCFWLILALMLGNICEYLEGFIKGKEDEA